MLKKNSMKKYLITLILLIILLLTTGCVKGELALDLKYTGAADLSCRLLVPPFMRSQLAQVEQEFRTDGFSVVEVRDTGLEGFMAVKSFDRVDEIKNVKIFKSFNAKSLLAGQQASLPSTKPASLPAVEPKQPETVVEDKLDTLSKTKIVTTNNLFTTTYDIDANLDLRLGDKTYAEDDKWLMRTLLSQVGLKFILKVPIAVDKSNAHEVSPDGKTLTWNLILGTENQVAATATIINPTRVGTLLGVILIIGVGIYVKFFRKKNL